MGRREDGTRWIERRAEHSYSQKFWQIVAVPLSVCVLFPFTWMQPTSASSLRLQLFGGWLTLTSLTQSVQQQYSSRPGLDRLGAATLHLHTVQCLSCYLHLRPPNRPPSTIASAYSSIPYLKIFLPGTSQNKKCRLITASRSSDLKKINISGQEDSNAL